MQNAVRKKKTLNDKEKGVQPDRIATKINASYHG